MPTPQTGTSLPKFNPETDLMAFIHIGKNGGTSFDKTMKITTSKLKLEYHGNKHFDWTHIENLNFNSKKTVKPVVLLRDPVDRVISHFYSAFKKIGPAPKVGFALRARYMGQF